MRNFYDFRCGAEGINRNVYRNNLRLIKLWWVVKKIFQEILTKMSRSITPAIVFMTLLSVAGKKKITPDILIYLIWLNSFSKDRATHGIFKKFLQHRVRWNKEQIKKRTWHNNNRASDKIWRHIHKTGKEEKKWVREREVHLPQVSRFSDKGSKKKSIKTCLPICFASGMQMIIYNITT